MLFPAVPMNIPNVKVCLKGEWSIDKVEDSQDFNDGDICFSKSSNLLHSTEFVQFLKPVVRFCRFSYTVLLKFYDYLIYTNVVRVLCTFESYADCFITSGAIQKGVPTNVFLFTMVFVS